MKKLLSLFLILVMVLAFCGCEDEKDVKKKTPSTVTTQNDNGFSIGTVDGKTYHNEFLGLSCTIPDGWVFYTQEQILELNKLTTDLVGDEIAEALKNSNTVYAMFAQDVVSGNNVNITLEKKTSAIIENLNLKLALETQIPIFKTIYTNMGYSDINMEYKTVSIDGKELDALYITAKVNGLDFYAYSVCFKKEAYLASIAIGTLQTNELDVILNCFTFEQ